MFGSEEGPKHDLRDAPGSHGRHGKPAEVEGEQRERQGGRPQRQSSSKVALGEAWDRGAEEEGGAEQNIHGGVEVEAALQLLRSIVVEE
jgi:hypothetical protein